MPALNSRSGRARPSAVASNRTAPSTSPQSDAAQTPPPLADQLRYIEDMVLELKEMAARGGFEALSGIFDIAHREAQLRRKETPGCK